MRVSDFEGLKFAFFPFLEVWRDPKGWLQTSARLSQDNHATISRLGSGCLPDATCCRADYDLPIRLLILCFGPGFGIPAFASGFNFVD